MTSDIAALLLAPFLASVVFVGMHTWLGLQVLRRKIVFADLALAQLAALGGTVAVAAGHPPGGLAGFGYALLFTAGGAALLTASRHVAARVGQEALIGIIYVVATALTVLVVDRSPQGAEHVRKMLIGSILAIDLREVLKLALLYGAVGIAHVLARRPLLALADTRAGGGLAATAWDFAFYLSFGLVVTSSVASAGVLLVFSFLIIPAVIGRLFTAAILPALLIGWGAGIAASAGGLAASFAFDAPTGAAMVLAFAAALALAALLRLLLAGPAMRRRAARGSAITGSALLVAAGLWLIAAPAADQPLIAFIETVAGIGPEQWMSERERFDYVEARETEAQNRARVEALNRREREARSKGEPLSADEIRRIAAFQQSWNEMGRGERFVQDHLRAVARERQRWWLGLPLTLLGMLGLLIVSHRKTPLPRTGEGGTHRAAMGG